MLDQAVRIFAHLEEICLLLRRFYLSAAVRALAVHQLGLCPEGLTRRTVKSLVRSLVDISLIVQLLKNLLHLFLMVCIGRADKVIVGRVHQIPDALYLTCHVIYILFWRNACFFCLLLNLLAMLICSGLEINVVALQSLITRDRICEHDLIRISDMRLAGCVGNRGRHVKFSLVTHFVCSFLIKQKNPVFGAVSATRRRDNSRGTTSIHTESALCASADIATNIPRCNRRSRQNLSLSLVTSSVQSCHSKAIFHPPFLISSQQAATAQLEISL